MTIDESTVSTVGPPFVSEDCSYPKKVIYVPLTEVRDKENFPACFQKALESCGGEIRSSWPYQIEGNIYGRFIIAGDSSLTFFLSTNTPVPHLWVLKEEEAQSDEAIAVISEAIRICNETDPDIFEYQVELNLEMAKLPCQLDLGDCVVYQFQPKDLNLPPWDADLGPDPFCSQTQIRTGFGRSTGPVDLFYTFLQGQVPAFHMQQADERGSREAEEIALFLTVLFKVPIYTRLGCHAVKDPEMRFTDHRNMMKVQTTPFSDDVATKVERPDISSSAMINKTGEIVVPLDINYLYSRIRSLEPEGRRLFLMASAMYRTALRLLVLDHTRHCSEAAQANLLLWSALEALVGRGERVEKNKGRTIQKYIEERLGKSELTDTMLDMWKHRCDTAHESIVWSWQLFEEDNAFAHMNQGKETSFRLTFVGRVERVVNALLIDFLCELSR